MPDYTEFVSELSPSTAGFAMEGGRATLQLWVAAGELEDAITDLLGDVESSGTGGLVRTLPKAHPRFPWMFASRISNIQGRKWTGKEPSEAELEAPPLDFYAEYDRYLLTVDFEPRPYPVLSDEAIPSESFTWYDESGASQSENRPEEWRRFCWGYPVPQPELITAQRGMMVFRLSDATEPAAPHLTSFPDHPRMILPKAALKFVFHQIPLQWVTSESSWIVRGIGKINQLEWNSYPAGSLLYTAPSVRPYTPPVPTLDLFEGVYSAEKLCDVEFNFEYTNRSNGGATPTISNPNWIAAGHNLLPWLYDRKFYYATATPFIRPPATDTDPSVWAPTYESFPFQLLFTDPDV